MRAVGLREVGEKKRILGASGESERVEYNRSFSLGRFPSQDCSPPILLQQTAAAAVNRIKVERDAFHSETSKSS